MTYTYKAPADTHLFDIAHLTIGSDKNVFAVEVADTPQLRRHGLMHRTTLCKNCGMLFVFPRSDIHPFWMKDTALPLDIVWVNNGVIVEIVENATPFSESIIMPHHHANSVIELPAGSVARTGIHVGDSVHIKK